MSPQDIEIQRHIFIWRRLLRLLESKTFTQTDTDNESTTKLIIISADGYFCTSTRTSLSSPIRSSIGAISAISRTHSVCCWSMSCWTELQRIVLNQNPISVLTDFRTGDSTRISSLLIGPTSCHNGRLASIFYRCSRKPS